jgi:hypothetical protein
MARLYAHSSQTPGPGDQLNIGKGSGLDDMTAVGNYLLVLHSARLKQYVDNCYLSGKAATPAGVNAGWELLAGGSVANGSTTKGHPRVLVWTNGNRYDVQTGAGDNMQVGVHEVVGFQFNTVAGITLYRGPIQSTVAASTGVNTISAGSGTLVSDAPCICYIGNNGRSDQPFDGDIGWTCIYSRNSAFTITEVNTIRAAMVTAMGGDIAGGVTAMKTVSGYQRLVYEKNDSTVSASTVFDYSPGGSPTNLGTGLFGTAPGADYTPAGPASQFVLVQTPGSTITTGSQFSPSPIIEIRDAGGNRTSSTLAVTASLRAGDGTLTGTKVVNAVNGQAPFADLGITDANGGVDEVQFQVATLPSFVSFSVTVDTSQVTAPATWDPTRNASDFTGTDRVCTNASQLAAALAACVDGDKILLAPGASFPGQFTLRNRGTTGWVEIRTNIPIATLDATCPQGTRMTPAKAAALNLAIIKGNTNSGGIISAYGARGYRITGVQVQDNGNAVNGLLCFGDTTMTQDSQICSYMVADRCYLRNSGTGLAAQNVRKGVYISCKYAAVVDSYIENMTDSGSDSQAISILGCAGPGVIRNNYLEGWSETIMWGGGNSGLASTNLNSIPSDYVVEGNYLTRNSANKGTGPAYSQQKNGIEFKDCRRAVVRYNVIERTWAEAQVGMGMIIKSDNASGQTDRPLAGSQDIEVYGNWFRDIGSGLQVAANPNGTQLINPVHRVKIHNNLIERVNQGTFTGQGRELSLSGPLADVYIDHNTFVKCATNGNAGLQLDSSAVATNVVMRSNILQNNTYGATADNRAPGLDAINFCLNPYTFTKNLVVEGNTAYWPATTLVTPADSGVGYTDLTNGSAGYKLAANSPYKNAGHDGADIGIADVDAFFSNLQTALTGVTSTSTTPPATPAPTSLQVVVQPAGFVTGVAGTTQPQVKVLDQFGAPYTGAAVTITAAIATGTGIISAGATAVSSTSTGIATFSGLGATSVFTTPLAFAFSAPGGVQSVTSATITLTVPDLPAPPSPTDNPFLALTFDWGLADPSLRIESIAEGRAIGAARTLIPALKDAPADAVLRAAVAELIYSASVPRQGTTAQRPAASSVPKAMYYDTTLNIPIWSDGNVWRDASGAQA